MRTPKSFCRHSRRVVRHRSRAGGRPDPRLRGREDRRRAARGRGRGGQGGAHGGRGAARGEAAGARGRAHMHR